jgi:hypothetical protein
MKTVSGFLLILLSVSAAAPAQVKQNLTPPIYIAFLWHMHQPIYWPYETVIETDQNGRYSYSVQDIHNQRRGPYTTWPGDAIQKGITANLGHFGAQVSFSGSLIENLNSLEAAGNVNFQNWKSPWNTAKTRLTTLGNPRLDMVAFGYHHPLMGLIDELDIRRQVQLHKQMMASNFSGSASRGMFPPENAFSPRMIPALADEGIEWVMVDNIHFDRACQGYPFSTSGNLYEPNRADIQDPDPGDWVALSGLWAPTQNSARWGRQPRYVEYIEPSNGVSRNIIAIPADRYLGNEDGRGGFGALNYEYVMSQLEPYNTDPAHPILIVLHHDGDNYGGGSEAYYNSNFQNFVNWVQSNPARFVCTTVQDYLELFPPDSTNPIHLEDGSWSGADNGDPEFKKWNGDPYNGYSPDRNSWGIITAAKNFIATANQINPGSANTQSAWKHFLNAEASDYWYWDGSQNGIWDSHPARASNLAIPYAQAAIGGGTDLTPPTIYLPQREPYNPGATEWGINQPSDFTVWTYSFDLSGLKSVSLRYRTDLDGVNSHSTTHNETYAGGTDVTGWTDLSMAGIAIPSQTNPQPLYKAREYSALVAGLNNVLVDYYVEAVDSNNNTARSPIMHVWVGQNNGGGATGVSWEPPAPTLDEAITITVTGAAQGAKLHWGVNNSGSSWQTPDVAYWPAGTMLFGGTGPAVETPLAGPDSSGKLLITIGPFDNPAQNIDRVAFVIHYNDNSWNNNNGQDFHITVSGGTVPQPYLMDGVVDTAAAVAATSGPLTLYLGWNGVQLYAATQSAQSQGGDMFIIVADSQRTLTNAMWAKSGSVAAWGAFLGNESSNNWNGWFNSTGSPMTGNGVNAAGAILEGALNIQSTFGHVPPVLYVAVGKYATADGGALQSQVPAGNGNGNMESTEFYSFPIDSAMSAPSSPLLAAPPDQSTGQPQSLMLRWHPSAGATSYGVQASTDSTFTGGFVVNVSSITDTFRSVPGLAQSTWFFWRARARNIGGVSTWSPKNSFSTLLLPPAQPQLISPFNAAMTGLDSVVLRWHSSAVSVIGYRLDLSSDSLFTAAVVDSSIVDTTTMLSDLVPYQSYWWRVQARNAAGSGIASVARKFTALPDLVVRTVAFEAEWSMMSNPVGTPTDSIRQLFPASLLAFGFTFDPVAGYTTSGRMEQGRGYWVKFGSAGTAALIGQERLVDTVVVGLGWNMIGSVSSPGAVTGMTTSPPGIIASSFYAYAGNGYVIAATIEPGKAYWVKTSASGQLYLRGGPAPIDTVRLHRRDLRPEGD